MARAKRSGFQQGNWPFALTRNFAACFTLLALLLMPLAMSIAPTTAHAAPVAMSTETDMTHCMGEHSSSPEGQLSAMMDCAVACAVVPPAEAQITTAHVYTWQNLAVSVVPLLMGTGPEALVRPPRPFSNV